MHELLPTRHFRACRTRMRHFELEQEETFPFDSSRHGLHFFPAGLVIRDRLRSKSGSASSLLSDAHKGSRAFRDLSEEEAGMTGIDSIWGAGFKG